MSEKLKKMNSVEGPLRKLRFCKWASPKMQQIIKQAGPSRHLFETSTFLLLNFLGYVAMSENLKKMNSVEGPLRKLRFCKWASPNMQQIIKEAGPSRQLFETVNFAFMKIFDLKFIWRAVYWFSFKPLQWSKKR